jgi:hypothetical protein
MLRLHLRTITHPLCIGALLASWDALGVFQRSPGVLAGTLDRLALAETALSPSLTSGGRCWSGTDSTGAIFVTRTSRPRTAASRSRCTGSEDHGDSATNPLREGRAPSQRAPGACALLPLCPRLRSEWVHGPGVQGECAWPGRLKTPARVPSRPGRGRDRRHSASGIRVDLALCHRGVTSGAPLIPPRRAASWPRVPRAARARSRAFKAGSPRRPFRRPAGGWQWRTLRASISKRAASAGQPPRGLCILRVAASCVPGPPGGCGMWLGRRLASGRPGWWAYLALDLGLQPPGPSTISAAHCNLKLSGSPPGRMARSCRQRRRGHARSLRRSW